MNISSVISSSGQLINRPFSAGLWFSGGKYLLGTCGKNSKANQLAIQTQLTVQYLDTASRRRCTWSRFRPRRPCPLANCCWCCVRCSSRFLRHFRNGCSSAASSRPCPVCTLLLLLMMIGCGYCYAPPRHSSRCHCAVRLDRERGRERERNLIEISRSLNLGLTVESLINSTLNYLLHFFRF